jgi:hypothetical protein
MATMKKVNAAQEGAYFRIMKCEATVDDIKMVCTKHTYRTGEDITDEAAELCVEFLQWFAEKLELPGFVNEEVVVDEEESSAAGGAGGAMVAIASSDGRSKSPSHPKKSKEKSEAAKAGGAAKVKGQLEGLEAMVKDAQGGKPKTDGGKMVKSLVAAMLKDEVTAAKEEIRKQLVQQMTLADAQRASKIGEIAAMSAGREGGGAKDGAASTKAGECDGATGTGGSSCSGAGGATGAAAASSPRASKHKQPPAAASEDGGGGGVQKRQKHKSGGAQHSTGRVVVFDDSVVEIWGLQPLFETHHTTAGTLGSLSGQALRTWFQREVATRTSLTAKQVLDIGPVSWADCEEWSRYSGEKKLVVNMNSEVLRRMLLQSGDALARQMGGNMRTVATECSPRFYAPYTLRQRMQKLAAYNLEKHQVVVREQEEVKERERSAKQEQDAAATKVLCEQAMAAAGAGGGALANGQALAGPTAVQPVFMQQQMHPPPYAVAPQQWAGQWGYGQQYGQQQQWHIQPQYAQQAAMMPQLHQAQPMAAGYMQGYAPAPPPPLPPVPPPPAAPTAQQIANFILAQGQAAGQSQGGEGQGQQRGSPNRTLSRSQSM